MAKHDITGERFGRLVALSVSPSTLRNTRWLCQCDCGSHSIVILGKLRSGHTSSCGCWNKEVVSALKRTHGQSKRSSSSPASRLYNIWCLMRQRCHSPKGQFYYLYGGRGIEVCREWDIYEAFELWALSHGYDSALSIDRINNDGNYEPSNCRWATAAEQVRNSGNARHIHHDGEVLCAKDIAARECVNYDSLLYRINKGMSVADALSQIRERINP